MKLAAHGRTVQIEFDDPSDLIAQRITRHRAFYEADLLEDAWTRIPKLDGGCIVDVGAHIGNHTLWFAGICGLPVIAIEPNPVTARQLRANVIRNGFSGRVTVHECAAGLTEGHGDLGAAAAGNTGTAHVTLDPDGPIPVAPLDKLIAESGLIPLAIKVDVEGAEAEVLAGAHHTLETHRPIVYVEASTPEAHATVARLLAQYGYREFGCFGKTPTYGFSNRRISLSVTVMADPRRRDLVPSVVDALDAPAEVTWDQKHDRWDTGRRSMLAYDPAATHHVVVQDDAIICRDFTAGLARALEHVPADNPVGLYIGNVRPNQQVVMRLLQAAIRDQRSWLVMPGPWWGVGVVVPTHQIPAMIAAGDKDTVENYDHRLARYFASRKLDCWYTLPSLVDHRQDHSSLVPGRQTVGRHAHWYIDGSALDIDWSKTRAAPAQRIPVTEYPREDRMSKAVKVMGPDGRTRVVTAKAFDAIYAPKGYVLAPGTSSRTAVTEQTPPPAAQRQTPKPRTNKPRKTTGAKTDA